MLLVLLLLLLLLLLVLLLFLLLLLTMLTSLSVSLLARRSNCTGQGPGCSGLYANMLTPSDMYASDECQGLLNNVTKDEYPNNVRGPPHAPGLSRPFSGSALPMRSALSLCCVWGFFAPGFGLC